MQMIIDNQVLHLKIRKNTFLVETKNNARQIHPKYISSIVFQSNASISKKAIQLAVKNGIQIFFASNINESNICLSSPQLEPTASMIEMQVLFIKSEKILLWVKNHLTTKIEMQEKYLIQDFANRFDFSEYLASISNIILKIKALTDDSLDIRSLRPQLLGLEGAASRLYWNIRKSFVANEWVFIGRDGQAKDPINQILNYWYGMFYGRIILAIQSAGLHPMLGVIHAHQYKKPVLAYDMIEVFRPIIDHFVFSWIKAEGVKPDKFLDSRTLPKKRIPKSVVSKIISEYYRILETEIEWENSIIPLNHCIQIYINSLADEIKNLLVK